MSTGLRKIHKAHSELHPQEFLWFSHLYINLAYIHCHEGNKASSWQNCFQRIINKTEGRAFPSAIILKQNKIKQHFNSWKLQRQTASWLNQKKGITHTSRRISVTPESMSCPLLSKTPLATPFCKEEDWDKAEKQDRKKTTSIALLWWALAAQTHKKVLQERKLGRKLWRFFYIPQFHISYLHCSNAHVYQSE